MSPNTMAPGRVGCVKLALVAIALHLFFGAAIAHVALDGKQSPSIVQPESSRERFRLPKMMSFREYKQTFHKDYKSEVEELARLKLYLARSVEAIISMAKYKLKLENSYLGISPLSDSSPEETRRLHPRPCLRCTDETEASDEHPQFESVAAHEEDGGIPLAKSESRGSKEGFQMFGFGHSTPFHRQKLEPPPLVRDFGDKATVDKKSDNPMENLQNWFAQSWDQVNSFFNKRRIQDPYIFKQDCVGPPVNQKACGSCYAITTLSIYEWLYCKANGKQVDFSVQYVMDCGRRLGLEGCAGGNETQVVDFTKVFGLELDDFYPLTGRQNTCRAGNELDPKYMGSYKLDESDLIRIRRSELSEKLRVAPAIVTIGVDHHFDYYGGGVDIGQCGRGAGYHSILIVGEGVEDGLEYWLMRNSYGVRWGLLGFYKMSKRTRCIFYEELLFPKAMYYGLPYAFTKNLNKLAVLKGEQKLSR